MQSSLTTSDTLLKRENNRRSKKARRLDNWRTSSWADLPPELLEIISNDLNIVDFQSLGRVCRSWRLFYSEFKQRFLTSQSPLVVYTSVRAKKYCYFFDMANRMKYKTKLPQYICNFKFCLGVSSGYLIMLCLKKKDVSSSYLWVINPVTGHEIQFPCMPWPPHIKDNFKRDVFRSLFASFGSQGQDFLIMILCKYGTSLKFCTSRDNKWKEYHYGRKTWRILDIVVFYGKIFVLTDYSRIGIFNLRSCDLNFMELQFAPSLDVYWGNSIRLVASNDQLFVVDDTKIYRIDLSRMEWVKVNNLGEQALFLGHGDMMCSKLINPTKWGGQTNCRYGLFFSSERCDLYSFNREEPRCAITIDVLRDGDYSRYASTKIYSWYFLHQSSSIDNVRDD